MNNSIFLQDTIKKKDLLAYCLALDDEVKEILERHNHIWDEYLSFSSDKMIVERKNERFEINDKEKIKQVQTTINYDLSNTSSVHYYFYQNEKLVFEKWINGFDFGDFKDIGEFYLKHEGSYSFIFSNNGKIKNFISEIAKDNEMTITESYMSILPVFTRMIYIGSIEYSIMITNFQYEVHKIIKTEESIIEKDLLLAINDQFKEKVTRNHSILLNEKEVNNYLLKRFYDLRRRGFQTIDEILKDNQ